MGLTTPHQEDGRRHRIVSEDGAAGVEITGQPHNWRTSLTAKPVKGGVCISVLDWPVIYMTPAEAQAFAVELLKMVVPPGLPAE